MASNRAKIDYLRAVSNSKYLKGKYGESSDVWKTVGTASLIGAELSESYANWANAALQVSSMQTQQNEIKTRSEISIANIYAQSEAVQGAQKSAFIKAGVKIEGSAISVLQETATKAMRAATIKQQETDFQNTQMEIQKRMSEVERDAAFMEGVLGAATTYTMGELE